MIFKATIEGIVAVKSGFIAFTYPGRVTNDSIIYPNKFSKNSTGLKCLKKLSILSVPKLINTYFARTKS